MGETYNSLPREHGYTKLPMVYRLQHNNTLIKQNKTMDYRDKTNPASDSMLFAFAKSVTVGALILSVFYGVGIPLYLAIKSTLF